MDFIPYINDLQLEIKILEDVKKGGHCDIEEINNNLYTILAHNCGASIETIARDCDRDYHMDAKKAIDYGLVDHIYQSLI